MCCSTEDQSVSSISGSLCGRACNILLLGSRPSVVQDNFAKACRYSIFCYYGRWCTSNKQRTKVTCWVVHVYSSHWFGNVNNNKQIARKRYIKREMITKSFVSQSLAQTYKIFTMFVLYLLR